MMKIGEIRQDFTGSLKKLIWPIGAIFEQILSGFDDCAEPGKAFFHESSL